MPADQTAAPALPDAESSVSAPRSSVSAPRTLAPVHVKARWLLALALALAAFNLRPAVAALGPQLDTVRSSLHMSAGVAGLVTALPSLCFALFGLLAPKLARRLGPAVTVCLGMAAVTLGIVARSFAPNSGVFLLLSALALAGIAVSNVLMPVLVKRYFPDRLGPVTGLYSMSLALGTSVAAALAVPLTTALGGGWRVGLGVWALAAAVALALWLFQAATLRRDGAGAPAAGTATIRITRSRTAWLLGVFFGLQATAAYVTMGWLPQIFQDAGISATQSGVLLAVTMAVGAPLSFVIPSLATRIPHQGPIAAVLAVCGLAAYAGLGFAPAAAPYVWALLLGIANCAFPLVLTMIGLRSRTSEGVARLSAFVQGVGYLISVPGPVVIGVLYQREHGWHQALILLAVLMTVQLFVGLAAGRPRQIEDER
ncbi:CP family cyanate transporter-like MFS transporter [Streptacidiphilus sp. BW17]|uniref:CynX/NimT family MFS transporter n=1 Tax=Streptacidiphilus sp. BW17 TaxID=3156274 RepID=UPI003514DF9B